VVRVKEIKEERKVLDMKWSNEKIDEVDEIEKVLKVKIKEFEVEKDKEL
jgi:hypothetical protein